MKTLNLFLKMHFTSLSPDGQCISLAIITDTFINSYLREGEDKPYFKSFYAEFTDFDINRCDEWVKSNVVSKLNLSYNGIPKGYDHFTGFDGSNFSYTIFQNSKDRVPDDTKTIFGNNVGCLSDSKGIKSAIINWLSQLSDYKLNFIVDCGWFTWYKFVELMGEWEEKKFVYAAVNLSAIPRGMDVDECVRLFREDSISFFENVPNASPINSKYRTGIPKLPANFPPVPTDINELILYSYLKRFDKSKSISDAFDVDRENLMYLIDDQKQYSGLYKVVDNVYTLDSNKYNALWDCKVTKAIYEKLK